MQGRTMQIFIFACLNFPLLLSSQKTCPKCGNMEILYPLSTNPNCGDPDYALACDASTKNLYFPALNGSSYLVLDIQAPSRRLVVQPSPWLTGTCTTEDMPKSEGIWLNQSLPFNITSSNTIFLFNCSPRLLISPLNCSASSLCHEYLTGLAHSDPKEQAACISGPGPCCTFLAGGLPSAYKIRLHASGCRAFRSVLHIDPEKPPSEWMEGLEIQWAPPPQPICQSQSDCPRSSACTREPSGIYTRCHCDSGYYWDAFSLNCLRNNDMTHHQRRTLRRVIAVLAVVGVLGFFALAVLIILIKKYKGGKFFIWQKNFGKEQEDLLKAGARSARMFTWKELRKATNAFSKDRLLGSGGFGEVYKGILKDGTAVAVKSAKVGNLKSTQQILNEVAILSLVNHKNLVKLLGCCVEAPQPLMVYEYIPNGTLFEHLHARDSKALNWKMRVEIALQTAEALSYLHSSTQVPIYHRDVKSSNILLDEELNVKVSDFGLSRLVQPGLSHVSTCAQGTLGYLDPEYYRKYQLTDKSDVYSFGVVLLELLTGKKVIDFSRKEDDVSLAEYVKHRARDGEVMDTMDESLVWDDKPDLKSVELFAELALDCLRERKEERRGMREVAEVLQHISRTV